ncbi:putative transcription factor interactor and regulator CCHC(Zn) family [Helianthus anomalus]
MDVKCCLASAIKREEKFHQITGRDDLSELSKSAIGFDKSKATCFRCREKGHFKREFKNKEADGRQGQSGKNNYYQKSIFHQIAQQPQTAHARAIEDKEKRACYGIIGQDDEKVPEVFSWDKYIPPSSGLVARILEEQEVKRTKIIRSSESDDDTDDEEE